MRVVLRIGGGCGQRGGPGKRVDGVFPGRPENVRYQRRPVDDCSPGREGMAQDDGTRGGSFYDEMDRRSRMPEREGKDQGEDSPKQAS